MKKTNFLKILMTLALAFAINGAFAQTPVPGEDDGAAGSNYTSTGTQATTAVTVGKTIPLYAWPDTYFSPTYDPIAGTGINAAESWSWTVPAGLTQVVANTADNYTEVTGATVGGPYQVDVVESGDCGASGTTESINISVLATPTVSITTPAGDVTDCAGNAPLNTAVNVTIGANGASNYRLVWSLEIYTMSGSPAAADEWFDTDKASSLGAAQAFAVDFTELSPDAFAASGVNAITTVAAPFTLINGKPTVYVYTVKEINDVVSRRGDFLPILAGAGDVNAAANDDFAYYDVAGVLAGGTTDVLTITVNPLPTTGPIYHIDNAWAN